MKLPDFTRGWGLGNERVASITMHDEPADAVASLGRHHKVLMILAPYVSKIKGSQGALPSV